MESPPIAEPRIALDHAFLNTVEDDIARALQRTAELDAGVEHLVVESGSTWKSGFDQLSASLTNWEKRLGELTRQTAAVEAELLEQENALRTWFLALEAANSNLARISDTRRWDSDSTIS
jgi:hypothetical protein